MKKIFNFYIERFIIVLIWLIFILISIKSPGEKVDEHFHHIPTLINFYNYGVIETIKSDKYLAANTPLPYLINLISLKFFYCDYCVRNLSRITTSFFALFTILAIHYLFSQQSKKFVFVYTLIVFFYPYFLKYGFTFYMAMYGVFFYLMALILLNLSFNQYFKCFLIGLSISLAILSQQYFIAIIPAYLVFLFMDWLYDKSKIRVTNKEIIIKMLIFFIPIIAINFPLFLIWGGLVTKNFAVHSLSFDRFNLTVQLVGIGGALVPISIFNFSKVRKYLVVMIPLAFIIVLTNYPKFNFIAGKSLATGMTFHFIELITDLNIYLGFLLKVFIVLSGLIIIYLILLKCFNHSEQFLCFSFIFLFFGNLFNVILAERHLLISITIGYLLLLNSLKDKKYIFLYLFLQIIIGFGYFVYYLFFQISY